MHKTMILRCSVLAIAIASANVALAQTSERQPAAQQSYDIPAQPLSDAVMAYARQTRIQVVFNQMSLSGLRSSPLSGVHNPESGLRAILANSGAVAKRGGRGVWIIERQSESRRRDDRSAKTDRPASAPNEAKRASEDDPTNTLDTITVTGSNISRLGPVGSDLIVLGQDEISRSGATSLDQLLNQTPQVFRGGDAGAVSDVTMSLGSQRALNMTAGSGVNLRGLGSSSTLILVNGRRVAASSGGTYTDITTIPIDAVERVEILADGASAVYGADAVGGVVNIILKSGSDSALTKASYGRTTETGREEMRLSHIFGYQGDRGGFTATIDHLEQSELDSTERKFTRNVAGPTTVLPANVMDSLMATGHLYLTESLSLRGDAQYSKSAREIVTIDDARNENRVSPVRSNIGISAEYQFSDWLLTLDVNGSNERAKNSFSSWNPDGSLDYSYIHKRTQEQRVAELKLNGTLGDLPGGSIRAAAGAGYKHESYRRTIDLYNVDQGVSRNSAFGFIEAYFPFVGDSNARPGLRNLQASVAVRHDDYSDFGASTNPRFGLEWSPTARLNIRASYSTSFRAPSIGEEARTSDDGLIGMELSALPADAAGSAWVPVLTWLGSEKLEPERAKTLTIGFDWRPAFAEGLRLGVTHSSIRYTDRITLPPLEFGLLYEPTYAPFLTRYNDPEQLRVLVESAISRGLPFLDFTDGEFGSDPLSVTNVAYNYLWTNAARVNVRTTDLSVKYAVPMKEQAIEMGLDASYIHRFESRLAQGSPYFPGVGTYGNPPRIKAKSYVAWSTEKMSTSMVVNYTGGYTDTTSLRQSRVGAYTTVDVVARYWFGDPSQPGLSVGLGATNLLDRTPPYIQSSGRGSHYDPGNASPLGRMLSIELTKTW